MKKRKIEIIVGIFVLIGIISIGYMTIKLGKMELLGGNKYNTYFGRFQSVTGLKPGAQIQMAGVEIGKVENVKLDPEENIAVLEMKVIKEVELTEDVIASVKTSGLIGDKYIKLSPGGSDIVLKSGDMITETESPIDIEELISKYVFGSVEKK